MIGQLPCPPSQAFMFAAEDPWGVQSMAVTLWAFPDTLGHIPVPLSHVCLGPHSLCCSHSQWRSHLSDTSSFLVPSLSSCAWIWEWRVGRERRQGWLPPRWAQMAEGDPCSPPTSSAMALLLSSRERPSSWQAVSSGIRASSSVFRPWW